MKDVISVDRILYKLAGAERTFRVSETKTALHALLISKLPDTPENKAVLAEMFRSGDEK